MDKKMSEIGLMRHLHERNKLAAKLECPDCNGGGLVKGSNEYEWETYLEPCEACNGDGCVEVQNKTNSPVGRTHYEQTRQSIERQQLGSKCSR